MGVRVLVRLRLRLLVVVMSRRWMAHGSYGDGRIRRELEKEEQRTRLGYVRARERVNVELGIKIWFSIRFISHHMTTRL